MKPSWNRQNLSRLFLFPEPDEDDADYDEGDLFEGQVDLDKSWHAIHFVLTGQLEPDGTASGDAILDGVGLGPDLGYGPARLLDANRVSEIAQALSAIEFEKQYQAVDRQSPLIGDVYAGLVFSEDEYTYLRGYFSELQKAYSGAASDGSSMIAYLTLPRAM